MDYKYKITILSTIKTGKLEYMDLEDVHYFRNISEAITTCLSLRNEKGQQAYISQILGQTNEN
jgi:hypothetical protein